MAARVKAADGLYYGAKGKPPWVSDKADARVFRTCKLAQGVVRVLSYNHIRAQVEKCEDAPQPG